MLFFSRKDTTLWLAVDHDLQIEGEELWLQRACASDLEADLAATFLNKRMTDRLRAIRVTAYRQGWRDAKAKKRGVRKLTDFFGSWFAKDVGWTE